LMPQIVQAFTKPPKEEHAGKFSIAQSDRVVMQRVQRPNGEHERADKDDSNRDEAGREPRAQSHDGRVRSSY
jgi:hypothetical protein